MKCWNCGHKLGERDKIYRNDECPKCTADLKCCRMCIYYDPDKYHQCRETQAEYVQDKEKRNHCDYFKIGSNNKSEKKMSKEDAKKKWNELFGKKDK